MTIEELEAWDEKIAELSVRFGLNCYPQEFEICDHNEMIGYMAYSGMPSRYSHWSFGKGYERQKTMYDHGVSGLPYEMVINSSPSIAYLMRDNTLLLQVLTIAHVYGHNDFFANNFTFKSGIDARYTIEMFKNHAARIDSYLEDPSIGLEEVEKAIDDAHALSLQCRRNLAIKKLAPKEQRLHKWEQAQPPEDPHWRIHPKKIYKAPELNKVPIEPDEDLLFFVAQYNPYLPEWKRDLIRIVAEEAQYFIPQIETKIMNEGWASFWHHRILNELKLDQSLHMEFLVRHNQVLRPSPGSINPYHLGFIIWHDIEKRWNEGRTGREFADDKPPEKIESLDENQTPGRRKIFEVREVDRDSSFLRRFLTEEIVREMELFQHERRGQDRVITKVADEENWETIKETLVKNVGSGSIPVIKVEDADFGAQRTLYLKHYHDGRDLQLEYAEHTLKHVKSLWEHDVALETLINGKKSVLKLAGDSLKVEKH